MSGKKGMPVWGWALIGCGGIAVIGVIIFVALGAFAINKGKEFIEDAERNPAHAMAKVIAFANPEIEVVDADDNAQTVTLRNTTTDETVTLNLEEIENGKVSWVTKDGEVSIDTSNQENGMVVTTDDGSMTYGGGKDQHPDWVPVYPAATTQNMAHTEQGESINGMLAYETTDSLDKVADWYRQQLEDGGFKITTVTSDNMRSFSGTKDNDTTSVTVSVAIQNDTGKIAGTIQYGKNP